MLYTFTLYNIHLSLRETTHTQVNFIIVSITERKWSVLK